MWSNLQICLDSPDLTKRLTNCVEATMNERKRVDIKCLVRCVVEELGEEYRDKLFNVLITAASRTNIDVGEYGCD